MDGKIKSREELIRIRQELGDRQSFVFTNGCFDILHLGHIRLFQEAKRHADRLIVAVNTDDTVFNLKGEGRPVFPLEERMEVLEAIEAVDYVVPFHEDTPLELILQLRPDILIKGGDWEPAQVVGKNEVESWGGKVIHFPYMAGFSTTRLVDKIKNE